MKNIFRTLAAVALIAMTAACSKDGAEALTPQGDKATVSFDVQLPGGIVGRATNDGKTANKLYYAVYTAGEVDKRGTHIEAMNGVQDINISTTVQLDLVANQKYDIVFWAQAEGKYAPKFGDKVIEMGYADGVKGSDETRDAFISVVDNLTINGATTQTVVMKRPFAQLNIGLTAGQIAKAEKAGFKLAKVQVTAQTYNTFSFETGVDYAAGTPTDELQTIKFEAADYTKDVTIEVNNTTYDWVSFNYLLADTPSDLSVVKVTFIDTEGDEIALPAFTNVPVERNHRTNIVGDLLTDPTNFNVTIDATFDDPANVIEEHDKVQVSTAAELKAALATDAEIIYLAPGVYDEVYYHNTSAKIITSVDPANKAVISGKFVANCDVEFKNVDFATSAKSTTALAAGTYGSKVNDTYAAIVTVNKVAASFEGCDFTGLWTNYSASAINFFQEATGKVLKVNNCSFTGNIKAIYAKVLFEVTNCKFDLNGGVAVYTWPRYTGEGKATFTGNENLSASDIIAIGCLTQSGNYANMEFNAQMNANVATTYAAVGSARFDAATITFAEGSATFGIDADGKMVQGQPANNVLVSSLAQLQAALNSSVETIYLADGVYEGNTSIDIEGKSNVTIKAQHSGAAQINTLVYITDSKVKLEGLALANPNAVKTVPSVAGDLVDQKVNGMKPIVGVYVNSTVEIADCSFDMTGSVDYAFSAYASTKLTVTGSSFECYKKRPIATNGSATTVDGCTFNNQYHYSLRLFENDMNMQTVVYTNNVVTGSNDKGEFEGINISKRAGSATILGAFTIKGNTEGLKYRYHKNNTMSDACTYDVDNGIVFEREN